MTELHIGAKVHCTDGEGGELFAVVVNPTTSSVTHLGVKGNVAANYLVPLERVTGSSRAAVQLDCSIADLQQMWPFSETHYVTGEPGQYDALAYMASDVFMSPYVLPAEMAIPFREEECVPPGELSFQRGTTVTATDGKVGKVDEFVLNPDTGHISHIVMREGHFWGQREITIPMTAIDRYDGETVHLTLTRDEVRGLPSVSVKRSWR